MRAVRLDELKDLLGSEPFLSFFEDLKRVRAELCSAAEHRDELLSQVALASFRAELAQKQGYDTVYQAGAAEDLATRLEAESAALENQGLADVEHYEEARRHASETWYRLSALERASEERRERITRGTPGSPEVHRAAAELAKLDVEVKAARETYAREDAKKQAVWARVEHDWGRSAARTLATAEKRLEAAAIKRRAEALLQQGETHGARAAALRGAVEHETRRELELRAREESLLRSAAERFGAALVKNFLYFRDRETPKDAWAVALLADASSYNLEVRELAIYRVDRLRGAAFLEPAVARGSSDLEGDRRFEDYFLHGRKGRVREAPGGARAS